MEKIVLQVNGMSCGHCEKAVTNALLDLGVANATANSKSGQVSIEFDPTVITADAIKNEIAETGYEVV